MSEPLMAKGVILEAVVAGLRPKLHRVRSQIGPHLMRYLDEPILASAWYPFDDYHALLNILASLVDPKVVPGDPYVFFGRAAAQRDIGGSQDRIPEKQRAASAGVYRNAVMAGQGVAGQIRRVLAVRKQYFSSSTFVAKRTGERTFRAQLVDFPVVSSSVCAVITGFLDEALSMLGLGRVSLLTCKAGGGSECAWELRLNPDVDLSELVAFE
jgi:hypothetical protein